MHFIANNIENKNSTISDFLKFIFMYVFIYIDDLANSECKNWNIFCSIKCLLKNSQLSYKSDRKVCHRMIQ